MRTLSLMRILCCLLLVLAGSSLSAQQVLPDAPAAPKSLAEINAAIATIQSQLSELNLKRNALENDRLLLIEKIATDQRKSAVEGGVIIVVRVVGERSVLLLINGQEQEVHLFGVTVKMGYKEASIALLNRLLLLGIAYPRCAEPSCSEVELFADKDKPSLNCQLVESGVAMLTGIALQCPSSSAAAPQLVDDSGISSPNNANVGSGDTRSTKRVPGTDVSVKGYYRKDGTYVKPHTRSAPGKRKN